MQSIYKTFYNERGCDFWSRQVRRPKQMQYPNPWYIPPNPSIITAWCPVSGLERYCMDLEDRNDMLAKLLSKWLPPADVIRLDFYADLCWPFRKLPVTTLHAQTQVAKELQKRCAATVLIYTLTEEDSSNDVAFDLTPLAKVPPFSRQVRCLPKDIRTLSSKAEKCENFPDSKDSLGVTRSSEDINLPRPCVLLLLD